MQEGAHLLVSHSVNATKPAVKHISCKFSFTRTFVEHPAPEGGGASRSAGIACITGVYEAVSLLSQLVSPLILLVMRMPHSYVPVGPPTQVPSHTHTHTHTHNCSWRCGVQRPQRWRRRQASGSSAPSCSSNRCGWFRYWRWSCVQRTQRAHALMLASRKQCALLQQPVW